jgi:threonine/homoserine/homoserine lactone efflux protein
LTGHALTSAFTGAALGLSAGLSPGPLLALVIAQTLAYSVREGIKVAAAPLLSDLPIVLAALALTDALAAHPVPLGLLTLGGAGYLAFCGVSSLRFNPRAEPEAQPRPRSVRKGVLANFLNPSPYLFWTGVGAPLLAQSWGEGPTTALAFLLSFYVCLVGAKVLVALISGRVGPIVGGPAYGLVMRGLGLMLLGYAGWFTLCAWRLIMR